MQTSSSSHGQRLSSKVCTHFLSPLSSRLHASGLSTEILSVLAEAAEELKPLAKAEGQKVLWAAVDVGAGYKEIEAGLSAAIKAAGAPVEVRWGALA